MSGPGPVRYEVTLDVDPDSGDAIERYMRVTHIPEILATGFFQAIRFERASASRVRTCDEAATTAAAAWP